MRLVCYFFGPPQAKKAIFAPSLLNFGPAGAVRSIFGSGRIVYLIENRYISLRFERKPMEENLKLQYETPETAVFEVQTEGRVIMDSGMGHSPTPGEVI